MSVAFNRVPSNIRVPFFYAEVNSGLSYFAGNSRHLIIGQKLASGSAAANTPIIVQRDDIVAKFGAGSMLAEQIRIARLNNPFGEIWVMPLADPAGVAAAWTITLSAPLTPGPLVVYIAGERIAVHITTGDTPTSSATSLASAINAGFVALDGRYYLFPVSAIAAAGVVTLTARHTGLIGNTIGVEKDRVGDEGANAAQISIAQTIQGSGSPSLTAGLAACGSTEFDMISMPYSDTTSLDSMQAFLADNGGRWDPTQGLFGACFAVNFGSLSAQTTLGSSRNDPNMFVMGVNGSPSPAWSWSAAIGAQHQLHKNLGAPLNQASEISRPMQTIQLLGIRPPKDMMKHWQAPDLETLYYDGISGYKVLIDGSVTIDRMVSSYQTNAYGSIDTTWLDVETRYQTAYALRYLKLVVTQTYPRSAIASDNPGGLQAFATPADIKVTMIHAYSALVSAGVMENGQVFADNLIVERGSDVNRINAYLPLDTVNQLRIVAVNATTFLNAAQ